MSRSYESSLMRPEDRVAFRMARLLLILVELESVPQARAMHIDRVAAYDFFVDNPFLVFERDSAQSDELLAEGFSRINLSYQSSAQRFTSRRERLRDDMAGLIGRGLIYQEVDGGRVSYRATDLGRETTIRFTSLYASSIRESARITGRELNRLSDRGLREQSELWLLGSELTVDLYSRLDTMERT